MKAPASVGNTQLASKACTEATCIQAPPLLDLLLRPFKAVPFARACEGTTPEHKLSMIS
jgi:hypothetical protein